MKTLVHNQKIFINHETRNHGTMKAYGNVSTLIGLCSINRTMKVQPTIEEAKAKFDMWVEKGESLVSSSMDAPFLSDSKEMYAQRDADRVGAIELIDGEDVEIDGKTYKVKYMGLYSDFIHFLSTEVA